LLLLVGVRYTLLLPVGYLGVLVCLLRLRVIYGGLRVRLLLLRHRAKQCPDYL
jgi:hypothetical protein